MNIKKLTNLFQEEENITWAAKRYAESEGIEYTDSFRRKCSTLLRKEGVNSPPAKILLFDIETSPMLLRSFTLYPTAINPDDIVEDWTILCFSAKYLFEDEVFSFKLSAKELLNRDDSRIVKELWSLLDNCSIAISHNGKHFDHKKANTKFLKYELNLPSPFQVIDTLEHARKKFKISSNKLDYISKYLGFDGKMETPKGLWKSVMEGNYESLKIMQEYCDRDVIELENVYLKMRPYIQPHPNIGLHIGDNVESCPSCGSENLDWDLKQPYRTNTNEYKAFRCNSCGSLGRSRTATFKQADISNLTTSNNR